MVAGPSPRPVRLRRRGSPRVSSRRNASVVVTLGVASLAAMVATSELLAESFDRPAADRLDPPLPDLGRPGIIQVEPPRHGWVKPPGRSRPPAAEPPRRRSDRGGDAARGGAPPPGGRAGTVVAVQHRPPRQEPVAVTTPAAPPAPPGRGQPPAVAGRERPPVRAGRPQVGRPGAAVRQGRGRVMRLGRRPSGRALDGGDAGA
jgi:hypothetical protein